LTRDLKKKKNKKAKSKKTKSKILGGESPPVHHPILGDLIINTAKNPGFLQGFHHFSSAASVGVLVVIWSTACTVL
jgi:hypothetical protein